MKKVGFIDSTSQCATSKSLVSKSEMDIFLLNNPESFNPISITAIWKEINLSFVPMWYQNLLDFSYTINTSVIQMPVSEKTGWDWIYKKQKLFLKCSPVFHLHSFWCTYLSCFQFFSFLGQAEIFIILVKFILPCSKAIYHDYTWVTLLIIKILLKWKLFSSPLFSNLFPLFDFNWDNSEK